jgi:hypothetical protein
MNDETSYSVHDHHKEKGMNKGNISGGAYGMAFIGAVIYYFTHAVSFWAGVLGFFKALFWPAFLIYSLLEFLKM